jgi:hypothetical protein
MMRAQFLPVAKGFPFPSWTLDMLVDQVGEIMD